MRDIRRRMTKRKAANRGRRKEAGEEYVFENIEQRLQANTHTSMRNTHTHMRTHTHKRTRSSSRHGARLIQGRHGVRWLWSVWRIGSKGEKEGRKERKGRGWQKRRGAGC